MMRRAATIATLAVAVMAMAKVARPAAAAGDALPPASDVRQMTGRWYVEELWYWDGPHDESCIVYDFSPDPYDPEDVCVSMDTFRSGGAAGPIRSCFTLNATENGWQSKTGGATLHLLDREGAGACTVRVGAHGGRWVALLVSGHPPDADADAVRSLRRRQVSLDAEPPLQHVRHCAPALCPPPPSPAATLQGFQM